MKADFNIYEATIQEACDYAVQQIAKQGERCVGPFGCVYTNGIGQHCAIGWLLNDQLMPSVSNTDIATLILNIKETDIVLPDLFKDKESVEILSVLQKFHDHVGYSASVALKVLEELGIDISGYHWRQWYDITQADNDEDHYTQTNK